MHNLTGSVVRDPPVSGSSINLDHPVSFSHLFTVDWRGDDDDSSNPLAVNVNSTTSFKRNNHSSNCFVSMVYGSKLKLETSPKTRYSHFGKTYTNA